MRHGAPAAINTRSVEYALGETGRTDRRRAQPWKKLLDSISWRLLLRGPEPQDPQYLSRLARLRAPRRHQPKRPIE